MRWLGSAIAAFVYAVLAGVDTLYAFVVGALACDETCTSPALRWQNDGDAWQWDALIGVGISSLMVAALVLALTFGLGRKSPSFAALAAHVALLAAAGVFVAAAGDVSGLFAGTGIALTLAAGAVMIFTRPPRREDNLAGAAKA